MALTRLQYAQHALTLLQHSLLSRIVSNLDFLRALNAYGSEGAEQQEFVETLVTRYFPTTTAHARRHVFLNAGIAYDATRDIPNREEPLL